VTPSSKVLQLVVASLDSREAGRVEVAPATVFKVAQLAVQRAAQLAAVLKSD